jgi:Putative restriction endonuclease
MANLIEAVDPSAVSVDTEWGWKPGDDEFVPDVLVTRPTHEELRYTGTPLLVAEVLSSNRAHDLRTKRSKYAAAGLLRYWTIDPETETVTDLELVDGEYRQVGSVRGTDAAVWDFGAGSVRIRPADLFISYFTLKNQRGAAVVSIPVDSALERAWLSDSCLLIFGSEGTALAVARRESDAENRERLWLGLS